jgi:hypothetical protein
MRSLFSGLAVAAVLLLASLACAQMDCSEEVTIDVGPGAISFYHSEAEFNCCAWIDVEVVQEGFAIDIYERERFEEGPCFCLCCFDAHATISGLAPGEYTLSIWKAFEGPEGYWTLVEVGEWLVTVEGVAEAYLLAGYVPCIESGAADDTTTWGTIKALYRGR